MKKSPSQDFADSAPPLYSQEILNFGKTHGHGQRLVNPHRVAEAVGALCGSRIIIDINCDLSPSHMIIKEIGYHVDACALGVASAAIFSKAAIGCRFDDIKKIHAQIKNMLNGEVFSYKNMRDCEEFSLLQAAKLYPSRHAAILLPLTASLKAFENGEKL